MSDTSDTPGADMPRADTPGSIAAAGMSDEAIRAATGRPFEVSASKTLPLEQEAARDAGIEAVSASLVRPASESRAVRYLTARWKLPQNVALLATANPASGGRTAVSLTHQRLADATAVAPARAAMRHWPAAASSGVVRGLH